MDGNRRWARSIGLEDVAHGHRRGADKIVDLLGWCDDAGVAVVTLFLLSTDNLQPAGAGAHRAAADHRGRRRSTSPGPGRRWQVRAMGAPGAAAAGDGRRPQAGGGGHPRPAGRHGEPRRRLRRTPGDRRRRPVAAGRARRARHLPGGAGRGRSTSSTSPSTSTPAASPIPTWSSAPAASSGCRASCSGRRRTPSSTSPTSTGRTSGGWTSCARCATTPPGTAGSAADRGPLLGAGDCGMPLRSTSPSSTCGWACASTGSSPASSTPTPATRGSAPQVADEPAPTPQQLRDQARGLLARARRRRARRPTAPTTCAAS